jgi:hypothetical protein
MEQNKELDSKVELEKEEKSLETKNYNSYWTWLLGSIVSPYSHWVLRNKELTKKRRRHHKFNLTEGLFFCPIGLFFGWILTESDYEMIGIPLIAFAILGFVYSIVALCTCKYHSKKIENTEERTRKRNAKKMTAIKIISIIGLVWCFFMPIYFFFNGYGFYDIWLDIGFASTLYWIYSSEYVGAASIFYAILYSIVGLSLFGKNKIMKTMSIIGLIGNSVILLLLFFVINHIKPFTVILLILFAISHTIVGLMQSSKDKGKKPTFIVLGIIILIFSFFWFNEYRKIQSTCEELSIYEEPFSVKEYDENYNTKPITQDVYTYEYDGLKRNDLPVDFLKFLNEFTKDKETQISLINKPLVYLSYEHENLEPTRSEWDENEIRQDELFFGRNIFIFGESKIDGREYIGYWEMKNGSVIFTFGISESSTLFSLIFKKIDGNWRLVTYDDIGTSGI